MRALLLALAVGGAWADGPALPTACERDADCRSLGVGARACGGPASWQAYSVRGLKPADEQALLARTRQAAEAERRQQAAEGRMSICQVLPDPGAHCARATRQCVSGRLAAD